MFTFDILEKLRESLDLKSSFTASDFLEQNLLFEGSYFSTRFRDYQKEILNDFSQRISVIKMSQTGLTTTFMTKMIAFSQIFPGKKSIIFTMPTDKMVKTFAKTRFLPLIEENSKIFPRSSNSDTRSAELLKIAKIDIHLLGCESDNSAFSIPSDYNIYDEVDETKPNAIDNLSSRLQGSALRMEHKLSTPTYKGFGIHKEYMNSSKGVYKTKCTACNHWNNPHFIPSTFRFGEKGLDVEFFEDWALENWKQLLQDTQDIWVPCERCGTRLIFGDPTLSEWVHEFPLNNHKGYAVTPFCLDKYNPLEKHSAFFYIFQKFIDHSMQGNLEKWYRSVLGLATNPDKDRIGEQAIKDIMRIKRPLLRKREPMYIGIDVGQLCFTTFLSPDGHVIRFQGIPLKTLKDQVRFWMEEYDVLGGCIDIQPESLLSQEIREMTNNRIMPVRYSNKRTGLKVEEITDPNTRELTELYIDRNHSLDRVAHNIKEHKTTINGWEGLDDDMVVRHFADNFKTTSASGTVKWDCPHNTDHGFHSLGYAYDAQEYFGGGMGGSLGILPFIHVSENSALHKL